MGGRAAWCRRIHDRVRYERTQCKEDRTEGDTGSPIPTPLGGVIAPLNEHPDIQSLSAPMGTGGRDETFTAAKTKPLNIFMRYGAAAKIRAVGHTPTMIHLGQRPEVHLAWWKMNVLYWP